jgi:glycosyltransferase involved in cell wall biosynthesis
VHVVILLESAEIIGGANKVALMTARALADDGVQVGVFAGSATADALVCDHPNIKLCLLDEVNFWGSKGLGNKLSRVTTNPVATRALAEFLSQFPVSDTIVHGHTFNSVLTASCLAVAIDQGYRTMVTCHDYGLACPNALFYDHRRVEICPERALSLGCIRRACTPDAYPHKLVRVARTAANWYRYRVTQRLSAAIVVSDLSLEALRPYFGDKVAFHMLPYPQDLREHAPVEVAKNSTFLFSGRLTPEKNPTILAKATFKLGLPVQFLGSGPEEAAVRKANPNAVITGSRHFAIFSGLGDDVNLVRVPASGHD